MRRSKKYQLDEIEQELMENMEQEFYEVQKILDMKQQDGKKYYLVKWLNWDVKTCTWQAQENVNHLKNLIKEYYDSRKFDQQHNMGMKKIDTIKVGMSPYQATKYYGHVLYGDQPLKITEIKVIYKNNNKELHFNVEWAARQNGFKPTNSLIESKILLEYAPSFVIDFYQNSTRLVPTQM